MKKCLFALALMSVLVAQAEEPVNEGSVLSTNTFGVLKVSSSCTNTIIAVPWADYSKDIDNPPEIAATNLVKTSNLKKGDTILFYAGGQYHAWELNESKEWQLAKMWSASTLGPTDNPTPDSVKALIKRGRAFWLVRDGVDTRVDKAIYLYGQAATSDAEVDIAPGSVTAPTSMLIANPFAFDLNLNGGLVATSGKIEIGEGGAYTKGDSISFTDDSGKLVVAYYDDDGWYVRKVSSGGRSMTVTKDRNVDLPVGTGFWYERHGSESLTLTFKASGKKD